MMKRITNNEFYEKYFTEPEDIDEMTDEELAQEIEDQNESAYDDYADRLYEESKDFD